MKQQAAAVFLL